MVLKNERPISLPFVFTLMSPRTKYGTLPRAAGTHKPGAAPLPPPGYEDIRSSSGTLMFYNARDMGACQLVAKGLKSGFFVPNSSKGFMPPPDPSKSQADNTSLFVGGLQGQVTEDDLIVLGQVYGDLTEVTILPDQKSGFLTYETKMQSDLAMKCMQGFKIRDVCLRINYATHRSPNLRVLSSSTDEWHPRIDFMNLPIGDSTRPSNLAKIRATAPVFIPRAGITSTGTSNSNSNSATYSNSNRHSSIDSSTSNNTNSSTGNNDTYSSGDCFSKIAYRNSAICNRANGRSLVSKDRNQDATAGRDAAKSRDGPKYPMSAGIGINKFSIGKNFGNVNIDIQRNMNQFSDLERINESLPRTQPQRQRQRHPQLQQQSHKSSLSPEAITRWSKPPSLYTTIACPWADPHPVSQVRTSQRKELARVGILPSNSNNTTTEENMNPPEGFRPKCTIRPPPSVVARDQ
ncbi:uncharacterized protein I303_100116 [Kwoniella dejecticola CBS 10117]|uniref:RRM domain-containing protein n=1 Tax=Kwoniella dejecticola CBS 10117 TaxID=1296121 RepID=A0A1A6AE15_9TREE|nr:uncharacterized protein I303_00116 [Kwoniella dejecticola CBS 10117]OBR88305.1 hypothetical protein I303_00116 [Kwoniella dejecticola CBS 10117]